MNERVPIAFTAMTRTYRVGLADDNASQQRGLARVLRCGH